MKENHKRFADKYFETLNAKESAIYAGFSLDNAKSIGWQLLQREDISNYITELKAEYSEKSGITKQWVIERFKLISNNSVQAEPVLDKNGEPIGEYKFDSSGANKATEMLGKIIGVFEKDNSQLKSEINNIINLGNGSKPDEITT